MDRSVPRGHVLLPNFDRLGRRGVVVLSRAVMSPRVAAFIILLVVLARLLSVQAPLRELLLRVMVVGRRTAGREDDDDAPARALAEEAEADDIDPEGRIGVHAGGREEGGELIVRDVGLVLAEVGRRRVSAIVGRAREVRNSRDGDRFEGQGRRLVDEECVKVDFDVSRRADFVRRDGGGVVNVVRVERDVGDDVVGDDVLEDFDRDRERGVEECHDLGTEEGTSLASERRATARAKDVPKFVEGAVGRGKESVGALALGDFINEPLPER